MSYFDFYIKQKETCRRKTDSEHTKKGDTTPNAALRPFAGEAPQRLVRPSEFTAKKPPTVRSAAHEKGSKQK